MSSYNTNTNTTATAIIPQPKPYPIVGNAPDLGFKTPVQKMVELSKTYGPFFRLEFPLHSLLIVCGHELARELCDESRFEKKISAPLVQIRALAGDGLFTAYADEANWGKAHRSLIPAFGASSMKNYFDAMYDIAEQMVTKWQRLGEEHEINVADDMTRLTLDTIALCGFNYRFNSFYKDEMHPFVGSMVRALQEAGSRARRLPLQTKLMRQTEAQYRADIAFMHQLTDDLIAKRRALDPKDAPNDLLNLMLYSKDPVTGEGLDDTNIRYQFVTFLVAGHETTSGLLSFAFYLLLNHPNVLQKAYDEVKAVLGDEKTQFEHIARLTYLDQILRETLRLYPTAPAFAVTPREDTVIAGKYPVKKGEGLMFLLPSLHRDPTVWKEPEQFDPERFSPANKSKIPPNAWMPFGNGARSCIGRAFAWQEALLVMAMILQRFEVALAKPYALNIKESLTLKPDHLLMRVKPKTLRPRAVQNHTQNHAQNHTQNHTQNHHQIQNPTQIPTSSIPTSTTSNTPSRLLVLFGSNAGSAESLARRVASDALSKGHTVDVASLDAWAERAADLQQYKAPDAAVVVITASYNGQPPDNAKKFTQWIQQAPADSLAGVRFTVFGCGNRDWESTYQAVPTLLEYHFLRLGGSLYIPRGEADARGDFFGDFERWYAAFWPALGEQNADAARHDVSSDVQQSLYDIQIVPASSPILAKQHRLRTGIVLENRELVDTSSELGRALGKSKRHLVLQLPEGMTYEAGDYLAVLPENPPSLVEKAAARFNLRPDTVITLQSTRGAVAASLPVDTPIRVDTLLAAHVELTTPATRRDVAYLAAVNPCPPHQQHLQRWADDENLYQEEILQKRVSVLDLILRYQSCQLSFAAFLELLPAMRVRQYSISSSPLWNTEQCTLTVAVVDAPAWSGTGQYKGVCSTYLARLAVGDPIAVAVRKPNAPFHPPADLQKPVVMIAAGTGIAPFRGFIQERARRIQQTHAVATPAVLFFGCDHPDVDFLYRDELQAWQEMGAVEILPVFWKQPERNPENTSNPENTELCFVQHRVWQHRERIIDTVEKDGFVFLCGDGKYMAPAVKETLQRIYQENTGCTNDEARAWLQTLESTGHFVADVFA